MSDLITRVRKALEFDETEAKDAAARRYEGLKDCGVHVITYQVEAARWDRARTAKLVEALVACVGDSYVLNGTAKLEAALKEMEKK